MRRNPVKVLFATFIILLGVVVPGRADQPQVHDLDAGAGEVVAVLAAVDLVESLEGGGQRRLVDRPGGDRHLQLVALADVAQVSVANESELGGVEVIAFEYALSILVSNLAGLRLNMEKSAKKCHRLLLAKSVRR